jgi:hypothetical protein
VLARRSVHLLSPGTSHARAGGGVAIFRGVANVLADVADVLSYEIGSPRSAPDCAVGTRVIARATPAALLDTLASRVRSGDVLMKFAGALPRSADAVADVVVADLTSSGVRFVYADADAPSRLPALLFARTGIAQILARADELVIFGGGARAAHEYRGLTSAPICVLTTMIAHYGVSARGANTGHPAYDLLVAAGAEADRDRRLLDLVAPIAADGRWRVAVYGRDDLALPGAVHLPFSNLAALWEAMARSRFTLNLLRADVAGYGDYSPCRIAEAARLGSVIATERFPGVERVIPPGLASVVVDGPSELEAALMLSADATQAMTTSARRRVASIARDDARRLVRLITADREG